MPTGRIFMADVPSRTDLWLPVTLRVAWELHTSGFRVRAQILDCAREHVLRSLPAEVHVEQAERLASIYTADFVDRYQNHRCHLKFLAQNKQTTPRRRTRHMVCLLKQIADGSRRLCKIHTRVQSTSCL